LFGLSAWSVLMGFGALSLLQVCRSSWAWFRTLAELWPVHGNTALAHRERLHSEPLYSYPVAKTPSEAASSHSAEAESDCDSSHGTFDWDILKRAVSFMYRVLAILEDAKVEFGNKARIQLKTGALEVKDVHRVTKEVRTLHQKLQEVMDYAECAAWRMCREPLAVNFSDALHNIQICDGWIVWTLCLYRCALDGDMIADNLVKLLPCVGPCLRTYYRPACPEENFLLSSELRFKLAVATGVLLEGDEEVFFLPERRARGDATRGGRNPHLEANVSFADV